MIGNTARAGAAVLGHYVHRVNCTIADSTVTASRRYWDRGGAHWNHVPNAGAVHASGAAELINTIVWGNSCPGGSHDPFDCQYRGNMQATFSCIQTLRCFVGIGTTSADPKLENYRLKQDSPCIDAGTDFVDIDPFQPGRTALPLFDLGGSLRIVDGDGRSGAVVDMGAYEFQGG
jgi:hypothetical protein